MKNLAVNVVIYFAVKQSNNRLLLVRFVGPEKFMLKQTTNGVIISKNLKFGSSLLLFLDFAFEHDSLLSVDGVGCGARYRRVRVG